MPRSRHTVGLAAKLLIRESRIKGAGCCECGHVKKVIREAAIMNRPDHIRSIETFSCAGVVAFKVVVEVEPLPVLQVHHAVESPAVFKLRKAASHFGELVRKVPGETAPDVKTGIAAFSVRVETVRRLRLVGYEVLTVTRIVNRV